MFLDWAPTKDIFGLALALAFPQCLTISQKDDDGYEHVQYNARPIVKDHNFVVSGCRIPRNLAPLCWHRCCVHLQGHTLTLDVQCTQCA